jgi:hypothetical protein
MKNIPKLCHLYWDRSKMSRLQVFTVESFHKINPDWKIFVYVPIQKYEQNDRYTHIYTGKDYFHLVEEMDYVTIINVDLDVYGIRKDLHNILRSDILRYHLLYDNGGVWLDFDIIWLKPIELLSDICGNSNFTLSVCEFKEPKKERNHYPIGVLVAAKKGPFYKNLIDRCNVIQASNIGDKEFQSYGAPMIKELFTSSEDILNKYEGSISIDYNVFYPYDVYSLKSLYKGTDLSVLTGNVLCLHWFNGYVLSKRYINGDLFSKNEPCCMTDILKREGYKGNI